MSDDVELARRAVACKAWRWMVGARDAVSGRRVYAVDECGYQRGVIDGDCRVRPDCSALPHDARPDLADPATLGCLLALVREAWSAEHAGVTHDSFDAPTPYWLQVAGVDHPDAMDGVWYCSGASYAGALVVALEAAP